MTLIHSLSKDDNTTTSYKNVFLIDSNVSDYQLLFDSLNEDTFGIIYSYDVSINIVQKLLEKVNTNKLNRLAFCCHENETRFLENKGFFDVSNGDVVNNSNSTFILDVIKTYNIKNVDFLACSSLKYDTWKKYYDLIKSQIEGVTVGASEDQTGNLKYGGNWVLENTGEQVDIIYFNEGLEYYKYLLTTEINGVVYTNNRVSSFNSSSVTTVFIETYVNSVTITHVDPNAFNTEININSINLNFIYFPNSITSIVGAAGTTSSPVGGSKTSNQCWLFKGCNNLEYINLSNTKILTIGVQCFLNCFNLKKLYLPDTVTQYQHMCFCGMGQKNGSSNGLEVHLGTASLSNKTGDLYFFQNSKINKIYSKRIGTNNYYFFNKTLDKDNEANCIEAFQGVNYTSYTASNWTQVSSQIIYLFHLLTNINYNNVSDTLAIEFNEDVTDLSINDFILDASLINVDLSNSSPTDWQLIFDYPYDVSRNFTFDIYYNGITRQTSKTINTIVPEPIGISYSNIEYYDTSKDFTITFDTSLLVGSDLSLSDISCGTYITPNSISQGSTRSEWILSANLETNIDSSAVIQVDYFGKIYSENIIIYTLYPYVVDISYSNIEYYDTSKDFKITFDSLLLVGSDLSLNDISCGTYITPNSISQGSTRSEWILNASLESNIDSSAVILVDYFGKIYSENIIIDTRPRKINSFALSRTQIDYINNDASLIITFNTEDVYNNSVDISSNIILTDNNDSDASINFSIINSIWDTSFKIWQGTIQNIDEKDTIANLIFSYNNGYEDISANEIITLYTKIPKATDISLNPIELTYVDTSGVIEVQFDKDLLESAQEIFYNYLTYTPSSVIFSDLSYNNLTRKWSANVDLSSNLNIETQFDISVNGYGASTGYNEKFNIYGDVPDVSSIVFDPSSLFLTYNDTSGEIIVTFDRDLRGKTNINDLIELSNPTNISINTLVSESPTKNVFKGVISVANIGLQGTDESVTVNGVQVSSPFTSNGISLSTIISYDTILPDVSNISITNGGIRYPDFSGIISVEFTKSLIDRSGAYYDLSNANPSPITIVTPLSHSLRPLTITHNDQNIWQLELRISEYGKNIVNDISFNYGYNYGSLNSTHNINDFINFEIDTLERGVELYVSNSTFTYLNTSTPISIVFDTNDASGADLTSNLTIKNNSNNQDIGFILDSSIVIIDTSWNGIITIIDEIDTSATLHIFYDTTSEILNSSITLNMDTIIPDVSSIIINNISNDEFTYLDTSGTLRFELTRPYLEPSNNFFDNNYLIFEPSQNLIIENLSAVSGSSNQIWEAIVSISGETDYPNAFVKLSYHDTSANYDFSIDTIIPDVSSVVFDKTDFNYNDLSTNIVVTYNRPIVETNIDSLIQIKPLNNHYSITTFQTSNKSIWTSVLTTEIGVSGTNAKIIVNGLETTSQHISRIGISGEQYFSYDTILPEITGISMENILYPYISDATDLSGILQVQFSKPIVGTNEDIDLSLNGSILFPTDSSFLYIESSEYKNNTLWEAIVKVKEHQYNLNSRIDVKFGYIYTYGVHNMDTSVNFQVDTRERDVNIQLSRTEFSYLDNSAILDISFNVEKTISNIKDHIFLYKSTPDNSYNFTITPNSGFYLSLNNTKRWTGTIQIDDNDYYIDNATFMFSYYTGYETISDTDYEDKIQIKTEIPDVSFIIINDISNNKFTYLDTSGTLRFELTRPYLEPSSNFINYLTYEPSNNLIIENLNATDSSNQIWEALVSISGEIDYSNAFVKMSYYDTSANYNFIIDTIIPDVSSIIIKDTSNNQFTYLDTSGTLQFKFTRPYLEPSSNFLSNKYLTFEPSQNVVIESLNPVIGSSNQIWEAIMSISGEIDVSNAFINMSYYDTSAKYDFEIDTVIPELSNITFKSNNVFNYLTDVDPSGILTIKFNTKVLETEFEIKSYLDYSDEFVIDSSEKINDYTFHYIFRVVAIIPNLGGFRNPVDRNININYNRTSKTALVKVNTAIPEFRHYGDLNTKSSIDLSNIDYINRSFNFVYVYTSGLFINDLSFNDYISITTSLFFIYNSSIQYNSNEITLDNSDYTISNLSSEQSYRKWSGNVSFNFDLSYNNMYVYTTYPRNIFRDGSKQIINLATINTIRPQIQQIILTPSNLTYAGSSRTIQLSFDKEILDSSINSYFSVSESSDNIAYGNFLPVDDFKKIWETTIESLVEQDIVLDVSFGGFYGLPTFDASFEINTIIPKIENPENDIILNASTITYLDLSGELSITFNKELEDTSINSFVNVDKIDISLSDFTSSLNKTKWTSILTADRDISTNFIVSVNDFYGLNWSNNFYINTVYPEPEYIKISKTYFTYDDISGSIEFKFTKELLEPSANILEQYLVYELSQNIIISDLQNDSKDKTKWTAIITIIGEVEKYDTYIQLIYNGNYTQRTIFDVKVIIPRLEQINITNLLYPEKNTFTYLDGFIRNNDYKRKVYFDMIFNTTLEERDDEEIRNKILFGPSQKMVIRNFNRTDKTTKNDYNGGRYFRGEIDINGEIDISNAFIKIDNNFYAGDASAIFHINTIIPQLEQNPTKNSDNFSAKNPIIDVTFNTDYEILEDITRDFINVSPYEYWELLYYTREEGNRKQWNTRIRYKKEITNVNNLKATIKGKYRGQSVTVDVDMSGVFPQVNSIEFHPNVSSYVTNDVLSYQDTSGTIVVEFTNDLSSNRIQETLSSLQQRELIKVQPKEAKLKLNLTYSEISGNICKIVVSSKGEFKSSSSNIFFTASYLGTNKETRGLSMNTIIPRPIDISLSLLEFTRNNRNALLTVTYDEVILNETLNTMEEHIGYFIKPIENITFTDLSQNQTNKKIWTANLETTGNILDSTGLIKAKYLDSASIKSFNFLINTVIPFVKPDIGATLQPNGLPRNRMSINLTRNKTLAEQSLIPEIYNYGPIITSNNKFNEITIDGSEFHPTQLYIKIDYAGKYSQVPNKIRIKYYSPKKISFVFPQDLPKGYYYFRVIRLIYVEAQVGAQRLKEYKEFKSNYSHFFHKQH